VVGSSNVTAGLASIKPFEPVERPWYVQARDDGTGWTNTYVDVNTGNLTTTVAVPVYRNGDLFGVVGHDVYLDTIKEDILDIEPGFAFLLNAEGETVVFPGMEAPNKTVFAERTFEGVNLRQAESAELRDLAGKMVAGQKGVSTITIEGKESFVAYGPVEEVGWSLGMVVPVEEATGSVQKIEEDINTQIGGMVEQMENATARSKEDVDAEIREERYKLLAVLALMIVGIVLVARYFAGSITQPIVELKEKAELISKGGIGEELKVSTGDEIEDLANSFNRVMRTIKILQKRDVPSSGGDED